MTYQVFPPLVGDAQIIKELDNAANRYIFNTEYFSEVEIRLVSFGQLNLKSIFKKWDSVIDDSYSDLVYDLGKCANSS